MRKILVLLALIAPLALAAPVDKTVSWDAPTERVNGDALAAGEIGGYDLECSAVGGGVVYSTGLPATPQEHVTTEAFASGDYICRMRTIDADGLQSEWAESAVFTVGRCQVSDCRPMPPQSITVTVP